MSINADINDKEFYGYVAQEMANGVIDSGIMAKASAETDFDENKSKALYIKMRVADLIAQNKQLEKEKEKQLQQQALEAARVAEYIRANTIMNQQKETNSLIAEEFNMFWGSFNGIGKLGILGFLILILLGSFGYIKL